MGWLAIMCAFFWTFEASATDVFSEIILHLLIDFGFGSAHCFLLVQN